MLSTFIVGTNVRVSKYDWLKVLVVASFHHALLVPNEEVSLPSPIVEA